MPAGRPSKYDAKLCEKLIAKMREGYSLTAASAFIGIHRDTAHEWGRQHPEFSDAVKMGKALRVLKLEGDLLAAEDSPTVTSRIFALKNADPEEWRDKQSYEHTGKDGKDLKINGPTIILTGAPPGTSSPSPVDGVTDKGD